MKSLVAFVGFKASGKNTAAEALIDYNFVFFSFADAIKDCLAAIFCWDRLLLEGTTAESRNWRESVDLWWAAKLEIPQFTPRWAMMNFGTDIMRRHLNESIWVFNVERRISMMDEHASVALIDCRFGNEIAIVRNRGGKVIRIKRGDDPVWMDHATQANCGDLHSTMIMVDHVRLHESEWRWIGCDLDVTIENDGSVAQLHTRVLSELDL